MKNEIERRFLTTDSTWRHRANAKEALLIHQGYPAELQKPDAAVRIRKTINYNNDVLYERGIKMRGTKLSTPEKEWEVSRDEGESLLKDSKEQLLKKIRWMMPLDDGLTTHTDHFQTVRNVRESFVISEVEFKTEKEARDFIPPEWLGPEITGQYKWSNHSLCLNGFPNE
jgi:adenylate cyclase